MSDAARSPRASGHVYLSGFMAVGKSTVGPRLAGRLGVPFVDLDARIEASAGRTVAAIFAAFGEAAFRAREAAAVADLVGEAPAVVALGGGAVLDARNRATLRASGVLLTLAARLETVRRRVGDDASRPLLTGDLEARLAARAAAYADANATIDTDARSPDEVVAEAEAVLAALGWAP